MKYLKRLFALPFFLGLNLVSIIWNLFILTYLFMRYGAECISYKKKDEHKMIADIYSELVKKKEQKL